jgi:Uma2 family endonuclease
MGQAAAAAYVTLEDYFEAEVSAPDDAPRREWFDGVVYAMSRGSPEHGRLAARVIVALGSALPESCETYSSDTMLYIERKSLATYADASVICGARETTTVKKNGKSLGQAVTNPCIVVEVLSEATERYDRDGKFQAYKELPSLEEYVLVSQDSRRVEVFRRKTSWAGEVAIAGQSLIIHGRPVAVDAIYGP